MPHGITQCYLPPGRGDIPPPIPQPKLVLSKRPRRDARLSWPSWLVTYRDGIPARRRSPIQVVTGPDMRYGGWQISHKMHYIKHEQVATVMVATAHITTTAQLDPSYSPDGGNVHAPVYIHGSLGSYASAPPPQMASRSVQLFLQGLWSWLTHWQTQKHRQTTDVNTSTGTVRI